MTEVPFLFFENLSFDKNALLQFVNNIPDNIWKGPHIGNYDPDIELQPHVYDNKIFIASDLDYDFLSNSAIRDIANHFKDEHGNPYWKNLAVLKTTKDHDMFLRPIMQREELDVKNNLVRTWEVIIPIQGSFTENPMRAYDTKNEEWYTSNHRDNPFVIPSNPQWWYTWNETEYDFRITLHLRCYNKPTYQEFLNIYATQVRP